ncbi:MAG TPA: hypothetical protein IGS37_15360 [Synechococcales cyanobacterium M55_K2018_004]|nr:hypothetical protein [Synechococcales cyanobacterium M55_K2018_004]
MRHLILAGLLLLTPSPILAQFRLPIPRIPGLPTEVPIPPVPGLDQLLREEPPISTSLADAQTEIPLLDDYRPRQYTPMTQLQRGEHGAFRLTPGIYQLDAQSYCLHAGTHAPGGGDGYVYAPMKGKRAEVIQRILQRSVDYPQIPQRQIQMLIWSILARARMNDLSPELQAIARQLLTTEDINRLNGGALGQIPPEVRSRLFATLPSQVRQVLNAEAEMRSLLSRGNASYAQLEQIAVLAGNVGRGEGSRDVPEGRWSYHPNGFFIRYIPNGYSRTRIQISVPQRYTVTRDPLGRITAIADPQGNRIETVYDDSIAPRSHPRDPNLQAYPFRTIRYIRPHPVQRGQVEQFELQNTGWTFVHRSTTNSWNGGAVPSAAKSVRASLHLAQGDRYLEWVERAQTALEKQQQIQDYLNKLERQQRERSQQDIDDLIDLNHYRDGLEAATSDSLSDRLSWITDHLQRVTNAYEYAICALQGGCDSDRDGDRDRNRNPNRNPNRMYDPSRDVAVPGNTARQRLGQSARSYQ